MPRAPQTPGPVEWVGTSLDDLRAMPEDVRRDIGSALFQVQCGEMPFVAKSMTGMGSGVLEIRANSDDGDTFRTVYVVRYDDAIYVLHAFQKKAKHGIKTPQLDIDLIKQRLKLVEADQRKRKKARKKR